MTRLRVDIVRCAGVGVCSHVAADLIRVDSWGFPILDDGPLEGGAARRARAAVRACPRGALFVETGSPDGRDAR